MRRLSLLALSLLSLSACYGNGYGPGEYRSSRTNRWYDSGAPWAARIEETGIGLGIRLSEPAYVAVFEILPGEGVGLYYPSMGGERSFYSRGFTTLPRHRRTQYFDSYFTGMPVHYRGSQPRFYFLVASREPLRSITRFQRSNGALRSVLGLTAYNTMNYRRVMDDLVGAVVPYQPEEDWTTDVLAIWPSTMDRYAYQGSPRYVGVQCGGRTVILPLELAFWGCPRRGDRGVVVHAPANPRPRQPGDTTTVQTPGRRRPEPTDAGEGGATSGNADGTRRAPQRRTEPRDPGIDAVELPRARPGGQDGVTGREPPRVAAPAGEEGSESPRAEPRTELPRSRPEPAEPVRSEPREPVRAEPVRSEPREPVRSEPVRSEPIRSEPVRSEPVRSEPVRSEPVRSEPVQSEPRSRAPEKPPVR
jgi:hypothetical protein